MVEWSKVQSPTLETVPPARCPPRLHFQSRFRCRRSTPRGPRLHDTNKKNYTRACLCAPPLPFGSDNDRTPHMVLWCMENYSRKLLYRRPDPRNAPSPARNNLPWSSIPQTLESEQAPLLFSFSATLPHESQLILENTTPPRWSTLSNAQHGATYVARSSYLLWTTGSLHLRTFLSQTCPHPSH